MSYCRFSEGGVYAYATGERIVCCACRLTAPKFRVVELGGKFDRWAILRRLGKHFRLPRDGRMLARRIKKVGILDARETAYHSRRKFIEHLWLHRRKGDKVPADAFERLQQEIEQNGDRIMRLSKFSIPFRKNLFDRPHFLVRMTWQWHKKVRMATWRRDEK